MLLSAPDGAGLPPGPATPKTLQSAALVLRQRPWMERNRRRYGPLFTVRLLASDPMVVVSDPALLRQVFTAPADAIHTGTGSPVGRVLGKHSLMAIDEDRHLEQRRLLLPPFHGKRMQQYEAMIAEVTEAEVDGWPENTPFPTAPAFMRLTLRAMLRAVFGAEGAQRDELERLLPPWVEIASKIAIAPWLNIDYGARSPYARFVRGREVVDRALDALIDRGRADPVLAERTDVLALMLQSTHTDGSPMANEEIRDQLVTLLAAGHETTANTLAWILERLARHPEAYRRLQDEADAGAGRTLRDSAIRETQRVRPVIAFAGRLTRRDYELGGYVLPRRTHIALGAMLTHYDPALFAAPETFVVDRFAGVSPAAYQWIPFGGGVRRCIGAAFASMQMDVVLRTILERVDLVATTAPGERMAFRGVAHAPEQGAVVTLRRRRAPAAVGAPGRTSLSAAA